MFWGGRLAARRRHSINSCYGSRDRAGEAAARRRATTACARARRLRGADRFAAHVGPRAEGRPRQDLDTGAGRPVPLLHLETTLAQPRDRRRLPTHGGLARLSEIAPFAAAASAGRGAQRGGACRAARAP